ncbi:MAG: hypothetical protein HY905_04825 [Deltaproteobacteria bacterium]|nr:hypothetical protein [Deltaproteobacteria bacterium]
MASGVLIPDRMRGELTDRAISVIHRLSEMIITLEAHFDGRLDPDRLTRAVELVLDAEPVLGCRFVYDRWRPYWERLPLPINDAFLVAADAASFEAFACEPLDPGRGPQLLVCLWPAPEGDRLLVKVGHYAADAGAVKEAIERLAETYRRLATEPGYEPEPNVGGSRSMGQVMRHIPWSARPRITGNYLRAMRGVAGGAPPTRFPLTSERREGPPRYALRHLAREQVAAVAEYGRRRQATINDVVVTAVLRALSVLADRSRPTELRLLVTADLRRHLPGGRGAGLCNMSGIDPMSLGVPPDLDEGFDGLLARVTRHTRARKASWIGLNDYVAMLPVIGWMPMSWLHGFFGMLIRATNRWRRMPNGLTNMGPIRRETVDFDAAPRRAFLRVPPTFPPNFVLGMSGYGGELSLSAGWYPGSAPEALVERFFDLVVEELRGVEGTEGRRGRGDPTCR